jgi:hypothetical protein
MHEKGLSFVTNTNNLKALITCHPLPYRCHRFEGHFLLPLRVAKFSLRGSNFCSLVRKKYFLNGSAKFFSWGIKNIQSMFFFLLLLPIPVFLRDFYKKEQN